MAKIAFREPEKLTISGILRKVIHLTPEEHGVEKELVIAKVASGSKIYDVTGSPNFLKHVLDLKEDKEVAPALKSRLGNPVEFECEHRIDKETGYTNDEHPDGVLHTRTGYAIRDDFALSNMENKLLEMNSIGAKVNATPEQIMDLFAKMNV